MPDKDHIWSMSESENPAIKSPTPKSGRPRTNTDWWPKQLRVGSGTKGWAMLDNVPVWYELWRQLNGFPPSLYEEPLEDVLNKKIEDETQNMKKTK